MNTYTSICLDVGANSGDFCLEFAKRNPSVLVIAIEPIADLVSRIKDKAASDALDNLVTHQIAIDLREATSQLNVSSTGDWGTTSLLPFDESNLQQNEYWSQRTDLRHSHSLSVKTTRLDLLLERYPALPICYIKIDTQGYDVKVLKSLGRLIHKVQAGCLEAYTSSEANLYVSDECAVWSICNFLHSHNFTIAAIKPNDPACNEVNIFFHDQHTSAKKKQLELHLNGIPNYDDKHYWHCPSSKLHVELGNRADETVLLINNLNTVINTMSRQISELERSLQQLENSFFYKARQAGQRLVRALVNLFG